MKKQDEIKYTIAKKHGFSSWHTLMTWCIAKSDFKLRDNIINEAMQEYARVMCVEQKKVIVEYLYYPLRPPVEEHILAAPLATDTL